MKKWLQEIVLVSSVGMGMLGSGFCLAQPQDNGQVGPERQRQQQRLHQDNSDNDTQLPPEAMRERQQQRRMRMMQDQMQAQAPPAPQRDRPLPPQQNGRAQPGSPGDMRGGLDREQIRELIRTEVSKAVQQAMMRIQRARNEFGGGMGMNNPGNNNNRPPANGQITDRPQRQPGQMRRGPGMPGSPQDAAPPDRMNNFDSPPGQNVPPDMMQMMQQRMMQRQQQQQQQQMQQQMQQPRQQRQQPQMQKQNMRQQRQRQHQPNGFNYNNNNNNNSNRGFQNRQPACPRMNQPGYGRGRNNMPQNMQNFRNQRPGSGGRNMPMPPQFRWNMQQPQQQPQYPQPGPPQFAPRPFNNNQRPMMFRGGGGNGRGFYGYNQNRPGNRPMPGMGR